MCLAVAPWISGGYIVTPDPTLPDVVEAFKKGEIKEFERHSRLGFVDHAGFLKKVARAAQGRLQGIHPGEECYHLLVKDAVSVGDDADGDHAAIKYRHLHRVRNGL